MGCNCTVELLLSADGGMEGWGLVLNGAEVYQFL